MELTWKKNIFVSKYELYSGTEEVGMLKESVFGDKARGELYGRELKFKKKGFLNSTAEIIDVALDRVVGTIQFNGWGHKAQVALGNRELHWKYGNFWNSRWSISENGEELGQYKSALSKGNIQAQTDDGLTLLVGLFIHNHFTRIALVVATVSVIIISSS